MTTAALHRPSLPASPALLLCAVAACFNPSGTESTSTDATASTGTSTTSSATTGSATTAASTTDPATTDPATTDPSTTAAPTTSGSTGVTDTCSDGLPNGDETDIDCGGTCPPCEDDKSCLDNTDCLSMACVNSTCLGMPDCLDVMDCPLATDPCKTVECIDALCAEAPLSDVPCDEDLVCAGAGTCQSGTCQSTPAPIPLSEVALDLALGRRFDGTAAAALAGSQVSAIGDFNNDTVLDFAVVARQVGLVGKIYVVFGGPTLETVTLAMIEAGVGGLTIEADINASTGLRATGAGDINNDDFGDLLIAAPAYGGGKGAAFVVHGRAETTPVKLSTLQSPDGFSIQGTKAMGGFAPAATGLGDIDGDGFADFAVSDPNFDIANFVYGAVYLVYGAGNLVSDTIDNYAAAKKARRITAAAQSAQFGQTLAPAGDFNKDGRQDLLIGQPAWNKLRGRAFVVYLPATRPEPFSLPDVPDKAVGAVVTSNTFTGGTNLGASLAAAGDFDGDGTSDVVLGGAGPTFNRALVVRGGPDVGGMIEASQLVSKGTGFSIQGAQGDLLGSAVAGGLDLNGDGRGDLLLGTGVGFGGTGGAYVAFGRDTPATLLASDLAVGNGGFALAGEQANGEAGASVALVPSMNGDALADLLIGAPHYTSNLANAGRAYLVYGGDCHP